MIDDDHMFSTRFADNTLLDWLKDTWWQVAAAGPEIRLACLSQA